MFRVHCGVLVFFVGVYLEISCFVFIVVFWCSLSGFILCVNVHHMCAVIVQRCLRLFASSLPGMFTQPCLRVLFAETLFLSSLCLPLPLQALYATQSPPPSTSPPPPPPPVHISAIDNSTVIFHFEECKISELQDVLKAGPPPLDLSFWSFLTFLHHGIEEIARLLLWKFYKKIRRKSWSNVLPKLVACIGFLYKVVHKIGRLRKFNRSRGI